MGDTKVLYIVQQPSRSIQKNSKKPDNTKSNKKQHKNQANQTKHTKNKQRGKWSAVQFRD